MSGVDSRIVTMKFDNAQFEKSAATTMSTLGKLKQALNLGNIASAASKSVSGISAMLGKIGNGNHFTGIQKGLTGITGMLGRFGAKNPFAGPQRGLEELQASTNRFSMAPMTGSVTHVSKSFLALTTVALTALSTITSRAVSAGASFAKSFTVGPIMDGFHEYETNMNSIQTILANTGLKGKSGLGQVNGALNELNTYSDKTIYNFSEMARNIGTFTAAGVDLKTSVASIKGIANLAAISGSNSQQASTAMYQLSQAISSGRVGLQDWNSVVNAGMGGSVFQKALARTAANMGTVGDTAVKVDAKTKKLTINGKSFRESITAKPGEKSWLTSDVLTNTLKQFGGNMTAAQLKAQGFKDAQVKAILEMGKTGVEAATKVKTLTQLMGTLKEAVGSGWTKSFQLIFGDFGQAKEMFTSVSNVLGGIIGRSAKARNKVLKDWNENGGRQAFLLGIKNTFEALMKVVGTAKGAFHDIFPAKTGGDLMHMSREFLKFSQSLTMGKETSENLRRTLRGVFAVFDIAFQVVKGFVGVIGDLFGAVGKSSSGFLNFTGGVGDFIVSIDNAIKKGGALKGFFSGLSAIIQVPVHILGVLGHLIASLFGGFNKGDADGMSGSLNAINQRLKPMTDLGKAVSNVWNRLTGVFKRVSSALAPMVDGVGTALGKVGDAIANAFSGDNFSKVLDTINTGLLAAIVLAIKHFTSGDIFKIDVGSGGVLKSITGSFDQLTNTLKSMQAQVKADVLIKIAIAMALLTASIVALSLIDSKKLTKSLIAVGVGLGIMQVELTALSKAVGMFGALKLPAITLSLILLASAMAILTLSVKALAKIPLKDLAKGLGAVALLIGVLVLASRPLSANAAGMIRAGAGMLILAVGLKVMASAVKDFASLSWSAMIKGFTGLVGALAAISGVMRIMPKGMLVQAASLVVLGVALKVIASSVSDFASLNLTQMVKGFVGLAGSLVIIAGAMRLMPNNLILTASGLVVLGVALKIISGVMQSFGGMSVEQIAKGLITLAAALLVIAGGLALMSGTLAGSASLVVAAAALAILAPVLVVLGSLSWTAIFKGMVALAGAFTILGVAGLLLSPLTPILLGLSLAMLAFGAGLALVGVGALAFATAFGIVVAAGTVGIAVLKGVLGALVASIAPAIASFARGVVAFANIIGKNIGAFSRAFTAIIGAIINAVTNNIPRIGRAFLSLVTTAIRVVVAAIPRIVTAGMRLLLGLLNGIDKNISRIIAVTARIIVKFLNGIGNAGPKIADAGAKMIIKLINGLSRAIDRNSAAMGRAGANLGLAIIRGMAKGIGGGIGAVRDAAVNAAKSALDSALHFLKIRSPSRVFRDRVGKQISAGMAVGIDAGAPMVEKSALDAGKGALDVLTSTVSNLSRALPSEFDINPTITPVLDLTKLSNDATKIGGMLSTKPITAGVSLDAASTISANQQQMQTDQAAAAQAAATAPIEFTQINNSPKALSPVEIYRNTRNQLSLAKEALTK